jgi:UPF0755 protein
VAPQQVKEQVKMTTVVLAGFFLMLFAPCVFAIYGGRDKKTKAAIASSYEDRAVDRTASRMSEKVDHEEFDIPMRREEYMVQSAPPTAAPQAVVPTAVSASSVSHRMWHEEPMGSRRGPDDLKGIVEQAENEALVAHAMAAQANAAALAATARAAQARAQAAAEHAVEANRAAANHAAAVRVAQQSAAASEAALTEPSSRPELAVPVSSKNRSRRAA